MAFVTARRRAGAGARGSARPGLRSDGEPGNPSWSPDGRTLYYQLDQFGYRNIWAVDLESGRSRQLSRGNADDAHCDVSPDGTRLLFLRGHRALYLLPVAGGEPALVHEFAEHNRLVEFPAWTPDGTGIVFSLAAKTGDLFLLRPAASHAR